MELDRKYGQEVLPQIARMGTDEYEEGRSVKWDCG